MLQSSRNELYQFPESINVFSCTVSVIFVANNTLFSWSVFQDHHKKDFIITEAATQRCSLEKVFWKYAANLQGNTHAEVWFQQSCKATLLKSHFDIGVLLQICFIFSEHIFLRAPLSMWLLLLLEDQQICEPEIMDRRSNDIS